MARLDGKVALISGSGRGIGRAITLKLASEGVRMVVNNLDPEPAHEVVELIRQAGGEAIARAGNVTAPDFAEHFIKTAIDTYKGLDIIINNAGYTWDNVIQKMSDEQWYAIMDVHLTAPFRILRAAQPVPCLQQGRDKSRQRGVSQGGEHLFGGWSRWQRGTDQLRFRQSRRRGHNHDSGQGMGSHES